jgi:hypothetical protein
MWQKTTSKLALAAQMVTQVIPELQAKRTILLCDSWYAKQEVTALVEQLMIQRFVKTLKNDIKANTIRQLSQQKTLSFFSHTQKL